MKNNHDKLSTRLSIILTKLNSGETFTIEDLMSEFNVAKRTIQRDLNERFSYLPIKKENGVYSLEEYCLGKLNFNDIKNFASLSGLKDLYPNLDNNFIVDLLNTKINQTYIIKGHQYEDLSSKTKEFKQVNIAIVVNNTISCTYNNKTRLLNPYRLINTEGIWYLAAVENNTLKTYTFSKLLDIKDTIKTFKLNDEFLNTINENKATWFSETIIEVVLQIDGKVAEYFKRRDLLPKQKILKTTEDHLIVSTQVSYDEEILKLVRYWIPSIKIVSPLYLQKKLSKQLKYYQMT